MQFIPDGPDIPVEVLRAQEEGRLVLFCGAGVSKPAGLPLFKELLEDVYRALTATRDAIEESEFAKGNFDRVFTLLEKRFDPRDVRKHVRRLLSVPPDPRLETHSALIRLATDRGRRLRLVTTNFDRLFEVASPEINRTAAPFLPIPKPGKWNHLAHLHGVLDPEKPDGEQLVLSSADFGVAYLVERWASRFVGELFNHFTVLFVGYSVDDPVMRYLVDAIAAERRADNRIGAAFAIAQTNSDSPLSAEEQWRAKGIIPILYDPADNHRALHATLRSWSEFWSGGLGSKINVVTRLARSDPSALPSDEVSQFIWAVADPTGVPARQLSAAEANLAWLEPLQRGGLLSNEASRESNSGEASVALVDRGQTTRDVAQLDPVRWYLAVWLTERLDDPVVARWAVKSGGRLHAQMMELARRKLRASPQLPDGIRAAWLALTGAVPLTGSLDGRRFHHVDHRIENEAWSPSLRSELISLLAPCIELHESWASLTELDEAGYQVPRDSVEAILTFDCELQVDQGSLRLTIEALRARADYQSILRDIAFEVGGLLRRALDIQASLGAASADYDRSIIEHPSIEAHEQNHHFHGWTTLVDLARDSFRALEASEPESARALARVWRLAPYPLFRRLFLFAASRGGADPDEVLRIMSADPVRWVWSSDVRLEFFRSLPWLWNGLTEAGRNSLLEVVLAGPPREMFVDDLADAKWAETRDRWVWQRLARLRDSGASLREDALARLDSLESLHPSWRYTGTDREDFPSWSESHVGLRTDFSATELLALSDDELIRVLMEHESNREGLLDAWSGAVQLARRRAIGILDRLRAENRLDPEVWSHGIAAFRNEPSDAVDADESAAFLQRMPPELLLDRGVARALADAIRTLSKDVREHQRSAVLTLWDLAFSSALEAQAMESDSLVTTAINHPVGVLVEGLLDVLKAGNPARHSEIEMGVRTRLERVLDTPGTPGNLGRVIIASRLAWLFDIDRAWAGRRVVPVLDWHNPVEARGAWQGFLWSPWLGQPLWSEVKPYFLQTFDHLGGLERLWRTLGSAVAAVSIEGDGFLTPIEAADCLRKLDNQGREAAAMWIGKALEGAGEQAAELWRTRIQPWLEIAWPREPLLRGSGVSSRLAWVTTRAGEAFPEAAALVAELIGPSTQPGFALSELQERQLGTAAPSECLSLVASLVPDNPPPWIEGLRPLLNQILAANPLVVGDPRYQRLNAIAHRAGN